MKEKLQILKELIKEYLKWCYKVIKHKFWVFLYCLKFSILLLFKAFIHDTSKFFPSEAKYFIKTQKKFDTTEYGTPEYKQLLDEIKPSLVHHYKYNNHHPEFFYRGIKDMSLLELAELFCDWKAAIRNGKDGNIEKSLTYNKQRFNISEDVFDILVNTTLKI